MYNPYEWYHPSMDAVINKPKKEKQDVPDPIPSNEVEVETSQVDSNTQDVEDPECEVQASVPDL